MRCAVALALILAGRLAVATTGAAQETAAARHPGGVEIAAASAILVFFPMVGGHVSVPTPGPFRIEAGAQVLPYLIGDGDEPDVVTHLQLRVPFGKGPGSRRSVLVGATAFRVGKRHLSSGLREARTWGAPHLGLSWQWQRSAHIDMRVDLQGLVTSYGPIPLSTFSIIWHPARRWS